jgi:predicted TIM-barrel fold metal-dependent hydrolase
MDVSCCCSRRASRTPLDEWLGTGEDEPVLDPARTIVDPHFHIFDQSVNTRQTPAALLYIPRWLLPILAGDDPGWRSFTGQFGRLPRAWGIMVKDRFLLDDLRADADACARGLGQSRHHTVLGSVFLECGWYDASAELGFETLVETRYVHAVAVAARADWPLGVGIIGRVDLTLPAELVGRVLDAHVAASPSFRGVRYSLARCEPGVALTAAAEGISSTEAFRAGFAAACRCQGPIRRDRPHCRQEAAPRIQAKPSERTGLDVGQSDV